MLLTPTQKTFHKELFKNYLKKNKKDINTV